MAAELECVIERAVSLLSISTLSSILDAAIRSRFEFFPEFFAGLHAALIESVQVKLLATFGEASPLSPRVARAARAALTAGNRCCQPCHRR